MWSTTRPKRRRLKIGFILQLQIVLRTVVFSGTTNWANKTAIVPTCTCTLEARYYLYKYFRGRFVEAPRRYGYIYSQRRSCILHYMQLGSAVCECLCVCASVNLFGTCVYICTPIIELWFVYFVAKQNLLAMKTSNGFQLDTFIRSQLKCCPTRFPSFSARTDRYVHLIFPLETYFTNIA